MRKLKLQMQTSIDGYVAGPNGEMDWMSFNWDDGLKQYVTKLTEPVDTIVLGRKLAEGFIPHWTNTLTNPNTDAENRWAARKFVETPKVVFTNTLKESKWDNAVVENALVDGITKLKNASGSEIMAYGGATFVSDLIKRGLIDDLHLFVNPAAIGKGLPIFNATTKLKLVQSTPFECGIVVNHYQPVQQ